ncbi:MAG TPA: cytochrome c oxidase assembly protein [Gemmatimonadaceae bacterium]|jgi:putative membrane protein|nr:cytochrome c oxidase assembly protein [Gemmatimonadaceae bacterium]
MVLALLHTGARLSGASFSVHPSTVIGIVGLAGLYEWVAKRIPDAQPTTRQRVLYHGGLVLLFFSLNGWLHDLSDVYLFSAHMVQHLLLALVVAPLLLMGTPGAMLRPTLSWPGVAPLARWVTAPTHCFAIFTVVVAGWHLPPLYNYALEHHPVHIVQHLMFLVVSVLMWWPVLSPMPELPRLSYPGQMLYLFLLSIPMAIVAVYISYADTVLYPLYATAPRVLGITPMNDQLMGGLIMWIPGGLFFYTIISFVFFKWQQKGGVDTRAGAQVDWRPI